MEARRVTPSLSIRSYPRFLETSKGSRPCSSKPRPQNYSLNSASNLSRERKRRESTQPCKRGTGCSTTGRSLHWACCRKRKKRSTRSARGFRISLREFRTNSLLIFLCLPSAVRTVGGVRVGLGRFERTGHADSTGNFLNRPNLDSPSKEIEI